MEHIYQQELALFIREHGGFLDLFQTSEILNLTPTEIIQLVEEEQLATISLRIPKFQTANLFHFMYKTPVIMPIIQGSNAISALSYESQETENQIGKDWEFMARLEYGEGSLYTSKDGTKYHVAFYYVSQEQKKARKVLTANSENEVLEKMRVFKEGVSGVYQVISPVAPQILPQQESQIISFGQVYDEYMELWLAKGKTLSTVRDRLYCYNKFILPYFSDMDIKKITSAQVQLFYNKIKNYEDGTLRSHSVMKKLRSSLNAIFDFAKNAQGYIDKLPTYKVELPEGKPTVREERFFERQELVEIFADLISHEKYFLVGKILMGTGIRPQELLALQWSNINLDEKTIKITNAMSLSQGEDGKATEILAKTKTADSVRIIYVGSVVIEALKQLKAQQQEKGLDTKAKKLGNEDYVMLTREGKIHKYSGLYHNFSKFIENHGTFKHDIDWYSFRHCYASYCYSEGVNPLIVIRSMGHSGDNLTERVYTSIPKEKLAEGAEIYNEFLLRLFQDVYVLVKELEEKKKQEQQNIIVIEAEHNHTEPDFIETTEEITEEETNMETIQQKVNLKKTVTKRTKRYRN